MKTLIKRRAGWTTVLAAACAAGVLPACAPKSEPTLQAPPVAESQDTPTVGAADNTAALDEVVQSLTQKAQGLPGSGADGHRDAMREVLGDVAKALAILEGPEPSGAFRQQVRAIESSRDRLSPDAPASTIEPAIGTGLRAAEGALGRLGRDEEFAGATLDETLKKLDATIDDLDTVRAVGRPYVAADASRLIAQAVRQMADKISGRSTDAPDPAVPEAPADAPAPAEAATAEPAPGESPADVPAGKADAQPEEMPAEDPPADSAGAPAVEDKPAPADELNK